MSLLLCNYLNKEYAFEKVSDGYVLFTNFQMEGFTNYIDPNGKAYDDVFAKKSVSITAILHI